ncbi:MAG: TIGR00725 family protein [SAR202 cluster bacterium]|nr:TIGR00725 family protein [SAR202 cluster bacterium]
MTSPDAVVPPPANGVETRPLIISVIGGGSPPPRALALAVEVGRELAKRGCVVACGGLGGVMEAVCRGAKSAGGVTIGIMPGNEARAANPYVDYPIVTGMGFARNVIVAKTGRAVIAIDGAFGTLSEIGHALGDGIPVVGLETWQLPVRVDLPIKIEVAESPKDAVDRAIAAARARDVRERAGLH